MNERWKVLLNCIGGVEKKRTADFNFNLFSHYTKYSESDYFVCYLELVCRTCVIAPVLGILLFFHRKKSCHKKFFTFYIEKKKLHIITVID